MKPWVRPLGTPQKRAGRIAPSFNPVTGKRYHGINVLILGMDMRAMQSGDPPGWMTYQQAHEKRWQVRKGEKATAIFFTKQLGGKIPDSGDDETPDKPGKQFVFFMKTYAVFHASQVDGVPEYKAPGIEEGTMGPVPQAADIIPQKQAERSYSRPAATGRSTHPPTDHIQLPPEHAVSRTAGICGNGFA